MRRSRESRTLVSSVWFFYPDDLVVRDPQAVSALITTSAGDLRRAITYLQSASRLHSAAATPITALSIQEIGGVVPDHIMAMLGRALGVGTDAMEIDDEVAPSEFVRVQRAVEQVVREGFSAGQVLTQVCHHLISSFSCPSTRISTDQNRWSVIQLHDLLILEPVISARAKAKIALTLGEVDKCLTDGADEEIQLLSACCKISKAIRVEG